MTKETLKPAWQPGQSGNPGGRPLGSKNKLGEAFIKDVLADWQEHGIEAIRKVREERPADYLRVVASVIPKEINVHSGDDLESMSDEELDERLAALEARLGIQLSPHLAELLGKESGGNPN